MGQRFAEVLSQPAYQSTRACWIRPAQAELRLPSHVEDQVTDQNRAGRGDDVLLCRCWIARTRSSGDD